MIPAKALRLAGPSAHLVTRPRGAVVHVYAGPLTPSGRFVPRAARTVCRAHTRRLAVIEHASRCSTAAGGVGRVCARCSACLLRILARGRQAEPVTRSEFRDRFADLEPTDLAFALLTATTREEVDAAAHLSLVLFDVAATLRPVEGRGRTWPSLHELVHDARERVHGFPESLYTSRERGDALTAAAREARIARAKEIRADREARIERLGFTNAKGARP